MTTKSYDKSQLLYKCEEYEVFHLSETDCLSNFFILATNKDESKKILIPCDKDYLCAMIPYFDTMNNKLNLYQDFKEATENKTPYQMTFPFLDDPKFFGKYLKGLQISTQVSEWLPSACTLTFVICVLHIFIQV